MSDFDWSGNEAPPQPQHGAESSTPDRRGQPEQESVRRRIRLDGIVQGVGFRPFVYRLAQEFGVTGFVRNESGGVLIEAEGAPDLLDAFEQRVLTAHPPHARVVHHVTSPLAPLGSLDFTIQFSTAGAAESTFISPDLAVCPECLREMRNPGDRRFRHPFLNCTRCGPRYSIVSSLPYDRSRTSMALFPMCAACRREYEDLTDRRFHAQPTACPQCGPHLWLADADGRELAGTAPAEQAGGAERADSPALRAAAKPEDPLSAAVSTPANTADPVAAARTRLLQGQIIAVRGIGGFHLCVDPRNAEAVERLRQRKGRSRKPFALMARDLETIRRWCHVEPAEADLLTSSARPIVLLRAKTTAEAAPDLLLPWAIAPGQKYHGFMLPYAPLHHLLLDDSLPVLVMTSGNLSEEPIVTGNQEARECLKNIADVFLCHDREILQRCDDSIARLVEDRPLLLRRSRGYVPEPLPLENELPWPILATGSELKNAVALARGREVFLSQHIGDLDNPEALAFFRQSIGHLQRLLRIEPRLIVHDQHPDWHSTRWALAQSGIKTLAVQHHHAHMAAVMAEHRLAGPCIGIILDGTGYGSDGTVWGGEVLFGSAAGFSREAWLKPVRMPGGDAAAREPWRMAVSHLHAVFGPSCLDLDLEAMHHRPRAEMELLLEMIDKGVNAPWTSSCGRLFDAVAAIIGLVFVHTFEAEAAMAVEMAATGDESWPLNPEDYLPPSFQPQGALELGGLVRCLAEGVQMGCSAGRIARRFHFGLVEILVQAALDLRRRHGAGSVVLGGGVFQNALLQQQMVQRLTQEEFAVYCGSRIPVNDGGLAFGQVAVAAAQADISMGEGE